MSSAERLHIDDVDRKILSELLRDCRRSYRSLARRAGVSVGTILSRIRKLENAGVIRGYSALLDHEKLGYQLTVVAEITVLKGKLLEMEEAIGKLPNTCAVYDVTGLTDALVIAKFHTREELSKFTKNLLGMPFVDRTNTHVVLHGQGRFAAPVACSPDRSSRKLAFTSRQSSYLVGTVGSFSKSSGLWGSYSNTQLGTNETSWNIAHLTLYAGFAISVLAIWRGLRVPRIQPATTVPIRFVNVAGLKLAGAGSILEVVALVGNGIILRPSSSEPYVALELSLLAVGLLTAMLGMVIGLTIEVGLIRREIIAASTLKRWLMLISIILMFTSIWLTAAGFFFYLATAFRTTPVNLLVATFLAAYCTARSGPRQEGVAEIWRRHFDRRFVFNAVVYFFVVVVAQAPVYVPWGLLFWPCLMF